MGTGYDLSNPPAQFMPTSPSMRSEMEESVTPYPAMAKPYRITEPPTGFQRYVSASIGQNLPIFGASLFDRMPGTQGRYVHRTSGLARTIVSWFAMTVRVGR
jgi:hypothetical protein